MTSGEKTFLMVVIIIAIAFCSTVCFCWYDENQKIRFAMENGYEQVYDATGNAKLWQSRKTGLIEHPTDARK